MRKSPRCCAIGTLAMPCQALPCPPHCAEEEGPHQAFFRFKLVIETPSAKLIATCASPSPSTIATIPSLSSLVGLFQLLPCCPLLLRMMAK